MKTLVFFVMGLTLYAIGLTVSIGQSFFSFAGGAMVGIAIVQLISRNQRLLLDQFHQQQDLDRAVKRLLDSTSYKHWKVIMPGYMVKGR